MKKTIRRQFGDADGMMVADVSLAAEMGSVDALRSAAFRPDCSRKRRTRGLSEQMPGLASFFLNSSQGKALFTPASGAAHNFRRYPSADLRMPICTDGRGVMIHRRWKSGMRSKNTGAVRESHSGVRASSPVCKEEDELGLLRDIRQGRAAALWVSANALGIRVRRHGRRIGPSFALTKKENGRGRIRSS